MIVLRSIGKRVYPRMRRGKGVWEHTTNERDLKTKRVRRNDLYRKRFVWKGF
jgi:hypothetical protein